MFRPAVATRTCGLLVLLLIPTAPAGAAAKLLLHRALSGMGFESIELRRTADNHLYLSGKLEGRRRSFLVDTGWSETTVNQEGTSGPILLGDIKLGRSMFTNQNAVQARVSMGGKPAPFDVVLGLDFLRQHYAVIDCAANRLFTRRLSTTSEEAKAIEAALRRAGHVAVDLRIRDDAVLTCQASLAEHPFELLVDSGAAWSCLDWAQAVAWGLSPRPSMTRLSGAGNTGTRGLAVAEVNSLRLGEVEVRRTHLGLVNLADWGLTEERKSLSAVKGLLGGELLAAYAAVIDCGGLKLWLKPKPRK